MINKRHSNTQIKINLFFSFCLMSQFLLAQKTGKVEGRVLDKGQPLEFVTVTICKRADTTKIVYYGATDTSGSFIIDKVHFGDYVIKFSLIGYKPATQLFSITALTSIRQFKNYVLMKDVNFLQTVTVTSQKN